MADNRLQLLKGLFVPGTTLAGLRKAQRARVAAARPLGVMVKRVKALLHPDAKKRKTRAARG